MDNQTSDIDNNFEYELNDLNFINNKLFYLNNMLIDSRFFPKLIQIIKNDTKFIIKVIKI